MQIVILGAGGHAEVVADILEAMAQRNSLIKLVGFLDDNAQLHNLRKAHGKVFGKIADLSHIEHDGIVIGIGNNRTRAELYARMKAKQEIMLSAVHPSAIISPHADIAEGAVVCAGAIVGIGAVVGPNVILNTACSVDHHNSVGAHVHIAPGARLGGNVIIGKGTLVGIGATVMPQRTIGEWSVVGAGALVNRDVDAGITVVGVPALPFET